MNFQTPPKKRFYFKQLLELKARLYLCLLNYIVTFQICKEIKDIDAVLKRIDTFYFNNFYYRIIVSSLQRYSYGDLFMQYSERYRQSLADRINLSQIYKSHTTEDDLLVFISKEKKEIDMIYEAFKYDLTFEFYGNTSNE